MKKVKILLSIMLVAGLLSACQSDYMEPDAATNTGNNPASVGFDASTSLLTVLKKPTSGAAACTTADEAVDAKLSSGTISVKIPSTAKNGGSGTYCSEVQQLAMLPNAGDNVWKSVISGSVTISKADIGSQAVSFTRAFSADMDQDGTKDVMSYTVAFSGAGVVQIKRTAYFSSNVSAPTAGPPYTTHTQQVAAAKLTTAGTYSFSITIQTQADTNNAAGAVTVVLDGDTLTDGTASGLEDPTTDIATATVAHTTPAPAKVTVGGTAAALWAMLNHSNVPANAYNIHLEGTDSSIAAGVSSDSFPTISNLKISAN